MSKYYRSCCLWCTQPFFVKGYGATNIASACYLAAFLNYYSMLHSFKPGLDLGIVACHKTVVGQTKSWFHDCFWSTDIFLVITPIVWS